MKGFFKRAERYCTCLSARGDRGAKDLGNGGICIYVHGYIDLNCQLFGNPWAFCRPRQSLNGYLRYSCAMAKLKDYDQYGIKELKQGRLSLLFFPSF